MTSYETVDLGDGLTSNATPVDLGGTPVYGTTPVVVGPKGPKGDKGDTGETGVQGPKGLDGFEFSTTRVFENQYKIGEIVYYEGQYYRAIADNDAILPTSTMYWQPYSFVGPQGEQGPKGDQGDPGADAINYRESFSFASPAYTWLITHNQNSKALSVLMYDLYGNSLEGEITMVTLNDIRIDWFYPTSGTAIVFD